MQGKWIKIALGAIAVPVVTVGAVTMVRAYENGTAFQPMASNRELAVNRVVFTGEEDTAAQQDNREQDKDGESELWEKDKTAEDASSPNLKNSADYLFQTGSTKLPDGTENINLAGEEAANNTLLPGENTNITGTGNYVYDVTNDTDKADLIIEGNGQGTAAGTINGSGVSGSTGTGHGSGTGQGETLPTGTPAPAEPAPKPQPTARPADTVKDPEPEEPKADDPILDAKPFDSNQVQDAIQNAATPDDVWVYIGTPLFSDNPNKLYKGQRVDSKSIFTALDAWIQVDGKQYVWQTKDIGKYIRVNKITFDDGVTWIAGQEIPITIPLDADTMQISISYRVSMDEEWTEYVDPWFGEDFISYSLETGRIYVLDHVLKQEESVIPKDSILNQSYEQYVYEGGYLNLYSMQIKYFKKVYGIATTDKWPDSAWLDKIYTGWTENGEPVDWEYVSTPGRHILEPGEMLPLGQEYGVQLQSFQIDYTNCYLQTLKTWHGAFYHHVEEMKVPEGIQAVDMIDGTVVDYADIPDSVLSINTDSFQVNKTYKVSTGNQQYASSGEGLLLNKEETQILAIPMKMEELIVPDTIQNVQMTEENNIRKIVIQANGEETIPAIEVAKLKNCEISVSEDLVEAFYKKNDLEYDPEQNNRVSAGGKTYYLQNRLLYNNDGELRKILSEGRTSIRLTDEIKSIAKEAFEGQEDLTTLILSQTNDNVKLEEDCFQNSGIKVIQCYSKKQMENVTKQLKQSDGITVKALLQAAIPGYWYTVEERNGKQCVTLVQVPDNITFFDGKLKDVDGADLEITEIGENVFSKCKSLQWVVLPESVDTIGYEAFCGCSSLEGILIDTKDTITIGDRSLDECPSLRFVASNAMHAVCTNGYDPNITEQGLGKEQFYYILDNADGYGENAHNIFDSDLISYYVLKNLDEENCSKVLYGASETYGEWLAIRSGSELPEEVQLPESTQCIYRYAMADTHTENEQGKYSINWQELEHLHTISTGAFYNSALGGTVSINTNPEFAKYVIEEYAFWGCDRITEIQLKGTASKIGAQAFQNCTNLKKIFFGPLEEQATLQALIFGGCENLQEIELADDSVRLTLMEGFPFYFDCEERDSNIKLVVPEALKEYYLNKWRYFFTGYVSANESVTDYEVMYKAVKKELEGFGGNVSDEEVETEVNKRLLVAENRLRTMLGMDTVDTPTNLDGYTTESIIEETGVAVNHDVMSVSDGNAGTQPEPADADKQKTGDDATDADASGTDTTQEEIIQ